MNYKNSISLRKLQRVLFSTCMYIYASDVYVYMHQMFMYTCMRRCVYICTCTRTYKHHVNIIYIM